MPGTGALSSFARYTHKTPWTSTSSVHVYVIGMKLGNYATQVVRNNCLFGEIWRSGGRKGDILKNRAPEKRFQSMYIFNHLVSYVLTGV